MTGVVQPQLTGLAHDLQGLCQWAEKPFQCPMWQVRHFPQTGLQPQDGAAVVQLTAAGVVQPQDTPAEQDFPQREQQPLPNGPQAPQWPQ